MKIKIIKENHQHNGVEIRKGAVLDLDPSVAAALITAGVGEELKVTPPAAVKSEGASRVTPTDGNLKVPGKK